ncbi:uncharacterized protein B0T15DRAFT_396679 [Chaetomium strumarium]|uniref:Uncharacterized protein n=1 Tax=Chaetomium strumarium TaxID=1170767 RepID=A0AAJ0GSG7_9PEZI|nr:hypothetical protein B0T15DRAFT_396679 [Chaetomium strumarium]
MSPLLVPVLLLICAHQAAGLALLGRSRRRNNATLPLIERQGTVIATRYTTIFASGDGSEPRTANSGYECRVDLLNDLWGFCPTTVIAATDCGLAGACVDSFDCSKGCGLTNAPLTTFTCSDAEAPFCSTALLTLSNNVGPYSYIACGESAKTDHYMVFTTEAVTTSITKPTSSSIPSSTASSSSAADSQRTSTSSPDGAAQSTTNSQSSGIAPSSGDISTAVDTQSTTDANNPPSSGRSNNNSNSNNNTGAIIGGVVGCLALLCICCVATAWVLRRNKKATATASASACESSGGSDPSGQDVANKSPPPPPGYGVEELAGYPVAELSARGPAAYDTSSSPWKGGTVYDGNGRLYMAPVELPASPRPVVGFGVR